MNDESARTRIIASGFRTHVGYRTRAWRDGYAEVELRVGPEHLNSTAAVHGGVYATLLDAACGHAACFCTVPGNVRRCVTISLTTSFLEPAREGDVICAVGRLLAVEHRVAHVAGEVIDKAGRLLAIGQASFRYAPGSERPAGVARE